MTSKIRRCAVILGFLVAAPGCGSAGGAKIPTVDVLAYFLLGDPGVTFGGSQVSFTVGGAPSDGSVQRLDPPMGDALALTHGLDLAFIYLLAVAYDPSVLPSPPVDAVYDIDDALAVASLADDYLLLDVDVWLPVEADDDEELAAGLETIFDVGRDTHSVESMFAASHWFGLADVGIHATVEGHLRQDSIADFGVTVSQTADSTVGVDAVEVFADDQLVASLGSLQESTAQTLSQTFALDATLLDQPLEVRFTTPAGSFWKSFRMNVHPDLRLPTPPLDTRVYDLPSAPEGVVSIQRDFLEELRPLWVPSGAGSYGFAVAGAGVLEGEAPQGNVAIVPIDQDDAGAPLTTWRALYVRPGNPGLDDPYWKPSTGSTALVPPVVAARVLVGAWGISIANYDNASQGFPAHQVLETGNMTDVCPFDGDPETGRLVYVDNSADALKFIELDAMDQYVLDPSSTLTNAGWMGASGKAVSACRHPSGDLLFCTDGAPGELWLFASGASTAAKLDDLYDAPRTVRTAGNIAAVGCYGSSLGFGGVRLFVRGAGGTWGNAPFSRLGARSVGIDLKELPDGRVAVASTGFLSDKLILTILDGTTGEILDDQEIALPAGCTGPGHCAFVRDPGVDGVFVTCNTSRKLVLLPVDLGS